MAGRSAEVLCLYKILLREAGKFSNYTYRSYYLRRIKDAFREYKEEQSAQNIDNLLIYAKNNLEVIKRQVVLGQMYKDRDLVIEHVQHSEASAHHHSA